MKDLWANGKSDFKGKHFTMNDCKLSPKPSSPIKVVAAGQSPRGTQFAAEYADYNFMGASGHNQPQTFEKGSLALKEAAEKTGRDVGAMVLFMIIAYETDEEAQAKWDFYAEGVDLDATSWVAGKILAISPLLLLCFLETVTLTPLFITGQATKDTKADSTATASRISKSDNPVNRMQTFFSFRLFHARIFLSKLQSGCSLKNTMGLIVLLSSKRGRFDWFFRDDCQAAR
jgi:pyrimidine oxygenase